MKTRLIIAILAAAVLFCSCEKKCTEVVKPADLKPIDWNGWNDAYTVYHNLYEKEENIQYDHCGDTIRCYGFISRYLYEDYSQLSESPLICFECSDASQAVGISTIMNNCDKDSLSHLLDSSSYSDTCFVKGILGLWVADRVLSFSRCNYCLPSIQVKSIEDIYFKKSQP